MGATPCPIAGSASRCPCDKRASPCSCASTRAEGLPVLVVTGRNRSTHASDSVVLDVRFG